MARLPRLKYTAAQHSGFGVGGKPEFERGLEPKALLTDAEEQLVHSVGGTLFDGYTAAADYCDAEQYPAEVGLSLTPCAPGSFSSKKVGGLAIYIPAEKTEMTSA